MRLITEREARLPSHWQQRLGVAVLRLDYLSCGLTVLSTVLVGRKMWTGLVVAGVNSVLLCLIGMRTAQFGFIPANLFCIAVYGVSLRSWMRQARKGARLPRAAPDGRCEAQRTQAFPLEWDSASPDRF